MSVSVRIPTILRTYTGGEKAVTAQGANLAELIDDRTETAVSMLLGLDNDLTPEQLDELRSLARERFAA